MMKIREEYDGETSSKPFLTSLQKDIVAFISGYVCRKKEIVSNSIAVKGP